MKRAFAEYKIAIQWPTNRPTAISHWIYRKQHSIKAQNVTLHTIEEKEEKNQWPAIRHEFLAVKRQMKLAGIHFRNMFKTVLAWSK